MSEAAGKEGIIRTRDLARGGTREFSVAPSSATCDAIAGRLGIPKLSKLRFQGMLEPVGGGEIRLRASLGATVVQNCVATLAPVKTRIDAPVLRRFVAGYDEAAQGEDAEMPEDDTIDPLLEEIDLETVMTEALALSLPDYPRQKDAPAASVTSDPPGTLPSDEIRARPFAELARLRDRLARDD